MKLDSVFCTLFGGTVIILGLCWFAAVTHATEEPDPIGIHRQAGFDLAAERLLRTNPSLLSSRLRCDESLSLPLEVCGVLSCSSSSRCQPSDRRRCPYAGLCALGTT